MLKLTCPLLFLHTRDISRCVLPTITNIVNSSLQSGIFATEWKTAVIRPLLKKKGLEVILKNFRPVSKLSFISKLVEKCALNPFMRYLETNKLLPDYQSAYRRGFSTETALLKLSSDILWNMERQRVTPWTMVSLLSSSTRHLVYPIMPCLGSRLTCHLEWQRYMLILQVQKPKS